MYSFDAYIITFHLKSDLPPKTDMQLFNELLYFSNINKAPSTNAGRVTLYIKAGSCRQPISRKKRSRNMTQREGGHASIRLALSPPPIAEVGE